MAQGRKILANSCILISAAGRRFLSISGPLRKELKEVVVVGGARTPVGSFRGTLAPLTAPQLGSIAIVEAMKRAGIKPEDVQEVYMGCVVQANMGQAPSRQASLLSGIPVTVPTSTINKVCASGLKAIALAADGLMCDHQQIMVAGGMESMSNIPYYMPRGDTPYGGVKLVDGVVEILTDAYSKTMMGLCAEKTAAESNCTREDQDEFAKLSYTRTANAWKSGLLAKEVVPCVIKTKKGEVVVSEDEEYKRVNFEKMKTLKTVFKKDGTITAANASSINDGAAAVVLMTADKCKEMGLKPLARILGYADAAHVPEDFPKAPYDAMVKALANSGLKKEDIDQWEINEAFSVVVLYNARKLNLDMNKVNPNGGGVSIGHPIGMSGARLVVHLCNSLKTGQRGMIGICNGGGGAGAMALEKL